MQTESIFRTAALAGVMTLTLGLQTALAEPLVYVPLGGEGKIVVIDAAQDKIVDTITGVEAVHGLARTPDGQFLIAGSFEAREPGSALPEKPAGMAADEHAAHHAAAPAGAAKDDSVISTLSVIRTADGSVVRRIDVPGAVHHVAVSPDGRFAVVTSPNEDGISAIDLTSYQVVATVSTGALPNYAVFSPDSQRLYVSNAGDNTVSEIDTQQWVVRRDFAAGTGPEHMAPSPDGERLYVANVDGGTVSEIATNTGATLRTFDIGDTLHGIDLSRDGATLFVAARGQDKLVAITLATAEMRELALAPEPYHLATVGDTGKLYISSAGEPNVWVVDQQDLSILGTIPVGARGHQMAIAPGV